MAIGAAVGEGKGGAESGPAIGAGGGAGDLGIPDLPLGGELDSSSSLSSVQPGGGCHDVPGAGLEADAAGTGKLLSCGTGDTARSFASGFTSAFASIRKDGRWTAHPAMDPSARTVA